jgi:hypothetical protein
LQFQLFRRDDFKVSDVGVKAPNSVNVRINGKGMAKDVQTRSLASWQI